jgi:cytochrome c-type biogenesis protein CcmH
MTSRMRGVVLVVAVLLAAVGLWRAYNGEQPSQAERATAMYETLRCPTCTAESIADSQAPISASMRTTVRQQIADGRTDDEIREWFVQRYGATVLLFPPPRGFTALLWLLPVAVVLTAVGGWAVRARRRAHGSEPPDGELALPDHTPDRAPLPLRRSAGLLVAGTVLAAGAGSLVVLGTGGAQDASAGGAGQAAGPGSSVSGGQSPDQALRALQVAAERRPDDAGTWLALGGALDDRGDLAAAEAAYREALGIQPAHPAARLRLAFVMVRTDRPVRATTLLRSLLQEDPHNPEATLLLGTVQRQQGDAVWRSTLRRFLRTDPGHPAAGGVREMLEGSNP